MKWLVIPILCTLVLSADDQESTDVNVNARYLIDSVDVGYVKQPKKKPELSKALSGELKSVIGQKPDNERLESLASRIKRELRVPSVSFKLAKGSTPDHVSVTFEVNEAKKTVDMDLDRLTYHSKQGFTAQGQVAFNIQGNRFMFGLVTDNDQLAERFAGIRAGFERASLGTERLRLRFDFASYHAQWNGAALAQADPLDLYRNRTSFKPEATIVLAEPLELSFGVDFTRISPDGSVLSLRRSSTEASNAATAGLRYRVHEGTRRDPEEQVFEASYGIRSATPVLESDTSFTRHLANANYEYRRGRNRVDVKFLAGHISGYAPVYERFVLGNTRTLRGWNKYDLNPVGASNAIHGTIEYSYQGILFFYDTGAAWDRPQQREQKQALGFGLRSGRDGFQIAVAFPIRAGGVEPIFYAGIGF